MVEQLDEKTLVEQAKQGSKEAFSQLVERNHKKIYNLAYRMTGNGEDALDVSQEAFIKAWQALPNFKGESAFSTWLYRLASNTAIDLLRKENRKPKTSLTSDFLEDEEGTETQIPDERFSPEKALEQKELSRAVETGLGLLSDQHRQVLVMRELSGLSYQEIATTLELDLGTVKSRIARGRGILKKFLQKEGQEPK